MTDDTIGNTPADSTVLTGRVKWFNNKAGYGFVTVVLPKDSDNIDSDIFAHHSGISVSSEQYRYLAQGEYVNFTLISTDEGEHKFQASNITGIAGGKLMCETRNEQRQTRQEDDDDSGGERRPQRRRNVQRVRLRGEGVRDEGVWTLTREDNRGRGGGRPRGRRNISRDRDEE